MKILHLLITIGICMLTILTVSTLAFSQYANADYLSSTEQNQKTVWFEYSAAGGPTPWSDTVPPSFDENYTEYCAMGDAIRSYLKSKDIIPFEIQFSRGNRLESPPGTIMWQTNFFILVSQNDSSSLNNLGFRAVENPNTVYTPVLSECTIQPPSGKMQEMNVKGTNYSILYALTGGKVISATADVNTNSIVIVANNTGNGTITLSIPATIMDHKVINQSSIQDSTFAVAENGIPVKFEESNTNMLSMLVIPLERPGTQSLTITGTAMVPEFPFAIPILLAGIISSIVFYRIKFRK
ncbi:MAG: hypothetical protein KGH88_06505 [Thaumarchaeota archaeon]|nr:hypothetical protein [Nitrososphaerota archaeon]